MIMKRGHEERAIESAKRGKYWRKVSENVVVKFTGQTRCDGGAMEGPREDTNNEENQQMVGVHDGRQKYEKCKMKNRKRRILTMVRERKWRTR